MTVVIPTKFLCPLSHLIMRKTVLASDGHHYEEEYIEASRVENVQSPISRQTLNSNFYPDLTLQNEINDFLKAHPELYEQDEVYLPHSLWRELHEAITSRNLDAFLRVVASDPRLMTLTPREALQKGISKIDLNKIKYPDSNALTLATIWRSVPIVNEIRSRNQLPHIENLNDLYPDAQLNEAFIKAIKYGDTTRASSLLAQGADVNAFCSPEGNSALHIACKEAPKMVPFLFEHGVLITHNSAGETPLHFAARNNDCKTIDILLNAGSSLNETNNRGDTALHYAARANAIDSVNHLLDKKIDIHHKNAHKRSALMDYVFTGGERLDIVDRLVKAGAHLRSQDINDNCLLHYATSVPLIHYLIDNGAIVNVRNKSNHSVLCEASFEKTQAILEKRSLKSLCALKKTDSHPFIKALKYQEKQIYDLYIAKGVDVNIPSRYQDGTPLEILIEKGYPGPVKALLDTGRAELSNNKVYDPEVYSSLSSELITRINNCTRRIQPPRPPIQFMFDAQNRLTLVSEQDKPHVSRRRKSNR